METASFFSRLTFWWFNSTAYHGFKKPLIQDDLWDLLPCNKTEVVLQKFSKYYDDKSPVKSVRAPTSEPAAIKEEEMSSKEKKHVEVGSKTRKVNIVPPVFKAYWDQFFVCALLKLVSTLVLFTSPIILNLLITFINSDEPIWKGCLYALGLAASAFTQSMLNGQYEFLIFTLATNVRSSLISVIFQKSLKLSTLGKKDYTTGDIVNLMSLDTQKIVEYLLIVNQLWAAPLQTILCLYLLWTQIGIAFLAGMAVMVIFIPIQGLGTTVIGKYQEILMEHKDRRANLMNEVLKGIKVIKLYAWEPSFIKSINEVRSKEISALIPQAYIDAANQLAYCTVPFLVC